MRKSIIFYFFTLVVCFISSCDEPEINKYMNIDFVNMSQSQVDSIKIRFILAKRSPGFVVDSFMIRKSLKLGETTSFKYNMENNANFSAVAFASDGLIDVNFYRTGLNSAKYRYGFFGDGQVMYSLYRFTILKDTVKMCLPLSDFSKFPNSPFKCD